MKKALLIFTTLFFMSAFAQQQNIVFTKNRLAQIRKVSYNLNPFRLKDVSIPISRFETVKTITKEYAKENEEFVKDSLLAVEKFKNEILRQKPLNSILKNLRLFLATDSKFKDKKQFLIAAQTSSDSLIDKSVLTTRYLASDTKSYGGTITLSSELIFADNDLNPEFKKVFKEIYYSDESLKDYYQRMINRIESFPVPKFDWIRKVKGQIQTRDGSVIETKKYDIKFEPRETINIDGFEVDQEINYLNMVGTFIKIDTFYVKSTEKDFYVLRPKLKGQNIELNQFKEEHVIHEKSDFLMQNIDTKEYYLCNGLLLHEYEYTKSDEELKTFNEGYKIWKVKYESLINSTLTNIETCNSIKKNHVFVNVFGQKICDETKFSSQEKSIFNKNLDIILSKTNQISTLENSDENRSFYLKYADETDFGVVSKSGAISAFSNSITKVF